ncbi:MAG: GxxExxY protein [Pyrinomonadaceae bacterium]|nr:GxxExxY protein [Pyrinomonadaceae bacterium]
MAQMNSNKEEEFSSLLGDVPDWKSEIDKVTERIIGCAFTVGNKLGCGFLEKVYENALALELVKAGLRVQKQAELLVHYDGAIVGKYEADLVVNEAVLIELKAVRDLNDIHRAQCLNYLRATGFRLCLLVNFGNPRVEVKRIIL